MTTSAKLILIRHGQSQAQAEHRFAGHSDFDLSELGQRQASLTAAYLLAHEKVDIVYASDLCRAYHTALSTARLFDLPVIPDSRLREINAGKWEGLKIEEIQSRYVEDWKVWKEDFCHARCTGGESASELYDRSSSVITEIAEKNAGKTVVIATHAAFLRSFIAFASGDGKQAMNSLSFPPNASLNIFEYQGSVFHPLEIEFTGHLEGLSTSAGQA